ncbi:DUF1643 domain-containing protein [Methylobacterium oxalidis]|uniref:DUF1643 domain-containing protein n=1 Tax=Methylobacterium oxalidis TaxID=944322 RepID=A0A512J923_9HYPH|nr:DUF1643 domain-containing protein [Methylobacterium oxalidis]GEP06464.1 hypothetical protein MOX02_45020 [Methylobacterium oxalidis]GJE33512.1 hypothetical protein LDDCCGHA_3712 [Methylobacterium oxalidis]GLS65504.1 hypothetical protein GCM10007888_38860 [Methylobacterium oxalidis]
MPSALREKDLFGVAFTDTIQRAASLSRCGTYRFTLTRTWGEGGRVCFIGLNPSTADHRIDDPTVRRWIHFARVWGYGGFTAVNLYPFRSSTPAACRAWSRWQENGPDWYVRDVIQENLGIVVREAKAAALVVPCWGAGAWGPEWVDHVCEQIQSDESPWPDLHCFAQSKDGSPVHPMARGRNRIPDHAQPVLWRAGSPSEGAAA